MPRTEEQMHLHREKNFAVRAEPVRYPEFNGEKTVYVTYNGRQEYPISLAPHEARKMVELLQAEFNL